MLLFLFTIGKTFSDFIKNSLLSNTLVFFQGVHCGYNDNQEANFWLFNWGAWAILKSTCLGRMCLYLFYGPTLCSANFQQIFIKSLLCTNTFKNWHTRLSPCREKKKLFFFVKNMSCIYILFVDTEFENKLTAKVRFAWQNKYFLNNFTSVEFGVELGTRISMEDT